MKENFSFCLLTACLSEIKKFFFSLSSYFLLLFLLSPFTHFPFLSFSLHYTKIKISIKNFSSEYYQIRSFLLLKKFLMENFIFCPVLA